MTAPAPRRPASRRAALLCALALGAVLAAVWAIRRPIATAVIDRRLAAAGVTARYRIERLGAWRQRLTDVSIGDPAHPDLTADWIELTTHVALDGARVTGVRAGRIRMAGRLAGNRLSLGSIDRLLPSSTGAGPFRLPRIDLAADELAIELATPAGLVQAVVRGAGRLDDGFRGRAVVTAARLDHAGCRLDRAHASLDIATTRGAPTLAGPVGADRLACHGLSAATPASTIAATLAPDLASWRGQAVVQTGVATTATTRVGRVSGNVDFAGNATATRGAVTIQVATIGGPAAISGATVHGHYRLGAAPGFGGTVALRDLQVPQRWLATLHRSAGAMRATPIAPVIAQLATRAALARTVSGSASIVVAGRAIRVSQVDAVAAGGTRLRVTGPGITMDSARSEVTADIVATLAGGGLPATSAQVRRRADGGVDGWATVAPVAAGASRLALSRVAVTVAASGAGHLATTATLSGPVGSGHVDGLTLPLAIGWTRDTVAIGPACIDIGVERLAIGSLRLARAHIPACPVGPALVRMSGGRLAGAARIGALRLAGSVGTSPLDVTIAGGTVSLDRRDFAARSLAVRLGPADAATWIEAAGVTGSIASGGATGHFSGVAGQLGAVPLRLSDAEGRWRAADGALSLDAALTVADAGSPARFQPLHAEPVTLVMQDGTIRADGRLTTPKGSTRVADVHIVHALASGAGEATLAVPSLRFDDRLQPDALTPLALGVIADVRGTVRGDARIAWSPAGTTSTGIFSTDRLDLAAAFGPVTGLAGTLRFTDLLALESAPGQQATIATVNPGVAVVDGRVTYRLLPGARVRIDAAHWPFAGGSLDLEPTLLDLSATTPRKLTFTLARVDAAQFLQQFDFRNLSATGTFDGALPMIFDASGGRIERGQLRVRSGGNIAYLGDLTQKDLGFWSNLAFQALRSIDYRDLRITMNGPLAGEMITDVRFAGVSQGKGARSNFLIRRLQRLPFVFNIRIKAPFFGLIDSAQSFSDPSRLIQRNLPALLRAEAAAPPVQPADSALVP